jgi:hypothetical protein
MTDIVQEIQSYIDTIREDHGLKMSYLTIDELNGKEQQYKKFLRPQITDDDEEFPEYYHRSWCKLSKEQKMNRLMNYCKKLISEFSLNDAQSKQLRFLFMDSINNGLLQKRDEIEYAEDEARVLKVMGLMREGDVFFLRGHDHGRIKCKINIKMVPLNLQGLGGMKTTASQSNQTASQSNQTISQPTRQPISQKEARPATNDGGGGLKKKIVFKKR